MADETAEEFLARTKGGGAPDAADAFLRRTKGVGLPAGTAGESAPRMEFDPVVGSEQPVLPPGPPISTLATGFGRGVRDVLDPLAYGLAYPFGQGPTVAAGNRNDLAAYDAANSGNMLATSGRIAGQVAGTAPIMMTVNPAIGAVGRGLAYAGGRIAPAIGNALGYLGDFVGGTAGGSGMVGRTVQAGSRATQGAVLGGEAGALTSGQSNEPIGSQIVRGAETGAILGPVVPAVIGAGAGAIRAITGGSAAVPQATAQLAQMARDVYGIELKAPQIGLNPTLRYAASALKMVPGSGAGAEVGQVQSQFNRAVARTFGEDATSITPDVLANAQKRIGGVMNEVEQNTPIKLGDTFLNRAADIEANARASLDGHEFGIVQRQFDNIMRNLESGDTISGTTYGNLIHKGSALDAALNSANSNIRNYAGQIREALRDSLTASLSPEDAAAYQQARTQYKNLKTVEPLTLRSDTTGGATPSTGDISPAALRAAVNRSYGSNVAQAAPGQVPLHDLARIGQLMKEPPTSGTAERGSMVALGAKAAELGGAALAGHYVGLGPAAAGLAAGVVGGRAASAYLRSNFLARRMIDSALSPPTGNSLATQLQPYIGPAGVIARNQLAAPIGEGSANPNQAE